VALSRRRLLRAGFTAVAAVIGAGLLSRLASSLGWSPVGDASEAAAAAVPYDPAAHQWAFVCDATKCIGCGRCVLACKLENHVPLDPEYNRTWIERHVVTDDGTVFIDAPEGGVNGFPPLSTAPGAADAQVRKSFFVPRLCMQCENPPCVSVCPVGATYTTEDGITLVDQAKCIGCGYCVVACPYGARYLVPAGGRTPTGESGVADKCTWCYHRITRGQLPACVVACPVGARLFGDPNDPNSPVAGVLQGQRVQVLKPGLGTEPKVYYVGLEAEVQ
jgi:Fe-S-cluster-containing dehydrogenase component